jgi:hypothetical protein
VAAVPAIDDDDVFLPAGFTNCLEATLSTFANVAAGGTEKEEGWYWPTLFDGMYA